jgi:hypothetical protein
MTDDRADEIMRHFDVVAERLETQIGQVAEAVAVLGEKVDRSTRKPFCPWATVSVALKRASLDLVNAM